ncbi:MAG: peroxiredoxin (alkyl hydroperoxide reductase subunit C) [Alphaproteobacteria bacterium]|jgi:peroxiredoxin (alkyl hydroperoxide reductase subunit C)
MTLGVGEQFPKFNVKATVSNDIDTAFIDVNNDTYKGKWKVVFFYPKDFTFVCPTEIKAFGDLVSDFAARDTQILGGSVDSEFVHMAWRKSHDDLRDLPFPLLADVKRELSTGLGILDKNAGVSQRATFIVDPEDTIRFVMVTDLSVGRNPQEVLRVLDALQSDALCPCNWNKGEDTLNVKELASK